MSPIKKRSKPFMSRSQKSLNNGVQASPMGAAVSRKKQNLLSAIKKSTVITSSKIQTYNKIEDNYHISNKKALYINLKNYYEALDEDLFDTVPITFHIKEMKDEEFNKFQHFYDRSKKKLGKKKTS